MIMQLTIGIFKLYIKLYIRKEYTLVYRYRYGNFDIPVDKQFCNTICNKIYTPKAFYTKKIC